MRRGDLGDLIAFLAVADERSFTKAAAKLATSQSALSHVIRRLEARLGVRLLTRTTRSVAPTEAGERLLAELRPSFEDIKSKLSALSELREKPGGTVRITATEDAARTLLWPAFERLLVQYPDIHVEVLVEQRLIDIVAERLDAGVRIGEQVARDMIAVRIGPDMRLAVFGSPAYFERRPPPKSPRELGDHECIRVRRPGRADFYPWAFERNGRPLKARIEGKLVFNSVPLVIAAAAAGFGLAMLPEHMIEGELHSGRVVRVLEEWCPSFPGYHLYYPSRRQQSQAFSLVIDALRWKGAP